VKTDRVDVEAMVFTLKAYLLGDRSVCRPVRLPSVAEEDAKRLTELQTQLFELDDRIASQRLNCLQSGSDRLFAGLGPPEVSVHFAEELVGRRVRLQRIVFVRLAAWILRFHQSSFYFGKP